jgi:hypothetical protein
VTTRTARIGWVLAFVAVAAGLAAVVFWQPGASNSVPPIAATTDGGAPVAARPAPAHPPTPVVAPGACGNAMASIRRIQRAYPSGAVLPESANARLTADLARLDDACASMRALQQEFRDRELTPWLTYLPPATG